MSMFRVATLAPLALAAVLAGCGSSSNSPSSVAATSSQASGGSLTLAESEFKISPAQPRVARTGTITITVKNTGAVVHALTVQTPSGVVKTGRISPGASATLRVDAATAGRYTFFCPIPGHRQAGMQGVIVVGGGSAGSGVAPSTTTKSGGAVGY